MKQTKAVTCECGETVFAPTSWVWIAIVDREDGWLLEDHKWSAQSKQLNHPFYCLSSHYAKQHGKSALLHKSIVDYVRVDHINHNGHDNRKCNLRPATHQQNIQNSRRPWNVGNRFKGVHYPVRGKWRAAITIDGQSKHLGLFDFEVDAAIAYNYNAAYQFGEFAKLNPIPVGEWCHD